MIKPTVGRKVWYFPNAGDKAGTHRMYTNGDEPLDATIIAVWGDRMVNVLVTDIMGKQFPVLSCVLAQAENEREPGGRYVEWVPYQQGQAKASDELVTVAEDVAALKRKLAELRGLPSLEEEMAKADKAGNA